MRYLWLGIAAIIVFRNKQLFRKEALFLLMLVLATKLLELSTGWWKQDRILIPVLSIFLIVNLWHTKDRLHARYYGKMYSTCHEGFYTIEPYLRSIGVDRRDKVVSVPDKSPNITLYFMNQPGWSEASNHSKFNINHFSWVGAKYLVINDSSYLKKPLYKPFIKHQVGHYKGFNIYKIGK